MDYFNPVALGMLIMLSLIEPQIYGLPGHITLFLAVICFAVGYWLTGIAVVFVLRRRREGLECPAEVKVLCALSLGVLFFPISVSFVTFYEAFSAPLMLVLFQGIIGLALALVNLRVITSRKSRAK